VLVGLGLAGSKMNSWAGWEASFNAESSCCLSFIKPTADENANCSSHLAIGLPGVPLLLRAELVVRAGARSVLPAAVSCPELRYHSNLLSCLLLPDLPFSAATGASTCSCLHADAYAIPIRHVLSLPTPFPLPILLPLVWD